jgi:hypothetical protein
VRILLVHPGADYAVADVYDGLLPALRAQGVEVVPYGLSYRIARAASWLYTAWEASGLGPENKPTDADVAYQASLGALERALRLQVDWVLVVSAMFFHPDVAIMLRRAGQKVAALLTESPYNDDGEKRLLQWVDVAWTNERTCVEPYRQINPNVFYLPAAYDPSRHAPAADGADEDACASHDIVFVGTPFPERVELLEAIDWTGINLGLYGLWDDELVENSPLRPFLHEGIVSNEQAAELYRRAKIGLNLYRTSRDFEGGQHATGAESLNPRALELASIGCFQISNWRAEIDEVFGPSVVTFFDPGDLESAIRVYLDNEYVRHSIAQEARRRVQGRTFDERAKQIISDLARVSTGTLISA